MADLGDASGWGLFSMGIKELQQILFLPTRGSSVFPACLCTLARGPSFVLQAVKRDLDFKGCCGGGCSVEYRSRGHLYLGGVVGVDHLAIPFVIGKVTGSLHAQVSFSPLGSKGAEGVLLCATDGQR